MKPIHKVVILGAGALGGFYASRFYLSPGFSVAFAASGARAESLRSHGIRVNGEHYPVDVVDPRSETACADLIIVSLKHHQLAEALPDLKNLVGPDTVILSVMNGLDSEEMVGALCGMDKVLYCIAVGIDGVRQGGEITVANAGRLMFGEADNSSPSPKVARVQEALSRAGLAWETPVDMMRMLWWKFMINVGVNQASSVLRAPYGIFQQSEDARAVMSALMQEVITLAAKTRVNVQEEDLASWEKVLYSLSPVGKTSMLQDIEAGRKTEVEIFAGKVISLGEKYGIPTPANRMMFHLIRALENMAKID